MGYKVFVSYKYCDNNVEKIEGGKLGTARDYVDYLQENKFSGDDLNKAENADEDLSSFKDETIQTHLKDKIWDSSITLVLISPNMVDCFKEQDDQWIPWEVSYSLRTQTRFKRRSLPNGIIAVVLPDRFGNYNYFINYWNYIDKNNEKKQVQELSTDKTFRIISKNMFNQKNPYTEIINGRKVYFGDCSYMYTVSWIDFINNMDFYLNQANDLRDNISEYNIHINVN